MRKRHNKVTFETSRTYQAASSLKMFCHARERAVYWVFLAIIGSGCTRIHVNTELTPPRQFHELPTDSTASTSRISADDPWWRSLSDPQLNEIVEGVFSENLQLQQAAERVVQMRAVATQAGSQRWPTLSLDLGWSRTKQLNPFSRLSSGGGGSSGMTQPMQGGAGMAPTPAFPSSFTQDNFRASVAASYEVDLWGRIGSLTEAAELDASASEADMKAMAITLSASAVDLYLQVIEAQQRLKVLEQQLRDDEDMLKVVTARFNQGLSPHIEVLQQVQQRDRTRSQTPPLKALISSLKRRLAALRGAPNLDQLVIPDRFPELPALPEIGLPASVLSRRPDLWAAQARLSAADARVSAAVSARLPGLRLNASGGYQSFELGELFDDIIWSVAGSVVTPLFQGGRLRAEQKRAESALRERLLALKERYLSAYHEVEDALANEQSAVEQRRQTRAQLDSARALSESAERRYLQGAGDFLVTLSARQGLYASQLALVSTERAALSARVQLHRSLGGGWVNQVMRDAPAKGSDRSQDKTRRDSQAVTPTPAPSAESDAAAQIE